METGPKGRFDPLYRSRNWRFMTGDQRRGRNIGQEIEELGFQFSLLSNVGGNVLAQPLLESVNALPPADETSLGRIIIVRLPGSEISQIYAGIQLVDGSIIWQLMAENVGTPVDDGGLPSPAFTKLGETFLGPDVQAVEWNTYANAIFVARAGQDVLRYNVSTGSVTLYFGAFMTGYTAGAALHMAAVPNHSGGPGHGGARMIAVTGAFYAGTSYNPSNGNGIITGGSGAWYGSWYSPITGLLYMTNYSGQVYSHTYTNSVFFGSSTLLHTSGTRDYHDITGDNLGNFYVLDIVTSQVYKFNSGWTAGITIGAGSGTGINQLNNPRGVHAQGGILYVADSGNNRIAMWDYSGAWLGSFGGSGVLSSPTDISGDGNTLFTIAENGGNKMSRWQRTA